MFTVLSLWNCHCESSPGSSDECRTMLSGRRPPDGPSQSAWTTDPPKLAAMALHYIHHHLLLLVSWKADTHFTITWRAVLGSYDKIGLWQAGLRPASVLVSTFLFALTVGSKRDGWTKKVKYIIRQKKYLSSQSMYVAYLLNVNNGYVHLQSSCCISSLGVGLMV